MSRGKMGRRSDRVGVHITKSHAAIRSVEATGTGGDSLSREGTYCYFEKMSVENGCVEQQKGSRETCWGL